MKSLLVEAVDIYLGSADTGVYLGAVVGTVPQKELSDKPAAAEGAEEAPSPGSKRQPHFIPHHHNRTFSPYILNTMSYGHHDMAFVPDDEDTVDLRSEASPAIVGYQRMLLPHSLHNAPYSLSPAQRYEPLPHRDNLKKIRLAFSLPLSSLAYLFSQL
jgi:hypothetical protein